MNRRHKILLGGLAAGGAAAGLAAGITGFGMAAAGRWLWNHLRSERSNNLRHHTVLITGGSRGLGLALAEEFAQLGCNIVICARDEDELARARRQIQQLGADVVTVVCDVSRQHEVEHMVSIARQHFGEIDLLVNNAGIISVGPLLSQTAEDFKEAMDVMFWGTVFPTLAVLPQMIERGTGRIVNISSIGGKVSIPHLLPYSCAKFAVVGFSEGLHAELKRFGLHVLTVVPGLMRTGSHLNASFKGKQKHEYGWFALSGTNPLLSVSAERAARQIIDAVRRNQAELVISWQAKILAHVHGAAPGLTAEALGLVNRLLPNVKGASGKMHAARTKKGHESQSLVTRSPLTALGKQAARRYNQLGESA
jgi:short-subunit dehydrogenase